jgi:hypothetical protein
MAPQRKDDDRGLDSPPTSKYQDSRTVNPFPTISLSMATSTIIDASAEVTSFEDPKTKYTNYRHTQRPPWTASDGDNAWPWNTYLNSDGLETSRVSTQPFVVGTKHASSPSSTADGYSWGHPGWPGAKAKMNTGGMYAAAAITPIVVLAVIGGFVYFCMRKRKRQRRAAAAAAATQRKVQEMKTNPQATAQPYMAPPPAVSFQYTASRNHLSPPNPVAHPIILGPIPSGENGAYFTGIDTSDVISMTSATHLQPGPPNPFSDNDSLAEPPPPYRPRSAAPPSLTNTSRHSSFRASMALPTTSRTHLIERSPFDDPIDDDTISDLSGPTAGNNEDAMSAVSDLSYQQDPVVNRPSL